MISELLLPRPRRVEGNGADLRLERSVSIRYTGPLDKGYRAHARLENALRDRGLRIAPGDDRSDKATELRIGIDDDPEIPNQGYRLEISDTGVQIHATDSAGLFYGVATFEQLIGSAPLEGRDPDGRIRLTGLEILDAPDFPSRGVLLDISRNRVPSMATLRGLVELLAGLKINQLQLHAEHTFAYEGHEQVWRGASALTAVEVRALDAFCARRFVELVPNQSTLGNFQRWLGLEPYRSLAECPQGTEQAMGQQRLPSSLCPTDPAALELIADLLDQLLPNFSSAQINVGLDDTRELGHGRSAETCGAYGRPAVYLEYLRHVHAQAAGHERRIQLWADFLLEHPELLRELPRDSRVLARGYEADHPFAVEAAELAAAGLDFYVCPGTSSWNSYSGRTRNALLNLAGAALAGHEAGAAGYLITDWGGNGHLQPLVTSYPGLIAGAAFAWNVESAREPLALDLPALLDRHVFGHPDGGLGRAVTRLGNAYLDTAARPSDGTVLFHLLASPQDDLRHHRYRRLEPEGLTRVLARVDKVRRELAEYSPATDDQRLVRRELVWVADALSAAARFGLARFRAGPEVPAAALPHPVRRALRIDLDSLLHVLPALWLARSRPGGLADALAMLRRVIPDSAS